MSLEMVRYLVERLPVMVCPKWIHSRIQPIAINDLVDYLVSGLNTPDSRGRVVEIGGKDVTTYGGLMLGYARARGLRRWLISVPVLTPRLSSYWVHWVTPIPASVASHRSWRGFATTSLSPIAQRARPVSAHIQPRDLESALGRVIEDLGEGRIDTSWSARGASWRVDGHARTG